MRTRDMAEMSLREFYACVEAHGEYHGETKKKPEPMSLERLRALGVEGA